MQNQKKRRERKQKKSKNNSKVDISDNDTHRSKLDTRGM